MDTIEANSEEALLKRLLNNPQKRALLLQMLNEEKQVEGESQNNQVSVNESGSSLSQASSETCLIAKTESLRTLVVYQNTDKNNEELTDEKHIDVPIHTSKGCNIESNALISDKEVNETPQTFNESGYASQNDLNGMDFSPNVFSNNDSEFETINSFIRNNVINLIATPSSSTIETNQQKRKDRNETPTKILHKRSRRKLLSDINFYPNELQTTPGIRSDDPIFNIDDDDLPATELKSTKTISLKKSRRSLNIEQKQTRKSERRRSFRNFYSPGILIIPQNSSLGQHKLVKNKLVTENCDKSCNIVCCSFDKKEEQTLQQIKKLQLLNFEEAVTKQTTHIVIGKPNLNIEIVKGIALGCWIVRKEWLLLSLSSGKWVPEEDYEITEFASQTKDYKIQTRIFRWASNVHVFKNCGPIFVSDEVETIFKRSQLEALIKFCGGTLTKFSDIAYIAINTKNCSAENCVTEDWILDSIMHNELQRFDNYLLY